MIRNTLRKQKSTAEVPNFWEPNGFSVCLKRLEYSPEMINDVVEMFKEMIDQEAKIAKFYVDIAAKYRKLFTGGKKIYESSVVLYGSGRQSLLNSLDLLDQYGKVHLDYWMKLQSVCVIPLTNEIESHFNALQLPKEIKSTREDFAAVQKPYVENLNQLVKSRTNYLVFCQSLVPHYELTDSEEAFKDVDEKKNSKRLKLKKPYEVWNQQMKNMIGPYVADMKNVYQKCDNYETERLSALKKVFLGLMEIYFFNPTPESKETVDEIRSSVSAFSVEDDVEWWRKKFGPDATYDYFNMDKNRSQVSFGSISEEPDQKENNVQQEI
ncbi:Protein kinase C and casein kinase II substrate protein 3 [Thelohanellus kitauei]|uniref:Protein kinase C and casein kinase II substrate protein 3 n=1 Tax=Thelohanellus kitauei TaxID=669202 RepID=A0A0C2J2S9_THEKT|nr:Protein kinase C and casein kinase II substrate protein 3 [Thelohanellus kitauei]